MSDDIYIIPAEEQFTNFLQRNLVFTLGSKIVKRGKLIIFRRSHYCIQFVLAGNKNSKETLEIPIPFNVEYHKEENLLYFDYRLITLAGNNKDVEKRLRSCIIKNTTPSQYYDKILEISTLC